MPRLTPNWPAIDQHFSIDKLAQVWIHRLHVEAWLCLRARPAGGALAARQADGREELGSPTWHQVE